MSINVYEPDGIVVSNDDGSEVINISQEEMETVIGFLSEHEEYPLSTKIDDLFGLLVSEV